MVSSLEQVPTDFLFALGTLRHARVRRELHLDEIPAPTKLAPFAVALGAEILGPGDDAAGPVHGPAAAGLAPASGSDDVELATGRFILLHDPAGSTVWDGAFRIVTYIRAQLEPDMGNDALLGSVAWTWLVEALETHQVQVPGSRRHGDPRSLGGLRNPGRSARFNRHRTARLLDSGHPGHRSAPGGLGRHGVHVRRASAAARGRHGASPAAPGRGLTGPALPADAPGTMLSVNCRHHEP